MEQSTKLKVIIGVITVSALALLIFCTVVIWKLNKEVADTKASLSEYSLKMKELSDGLVRGEHSYGTTDNLEKMLKDMKVDMNSLQKDLDALDLKLNSVNVVSVKTPGGSWTNLPSDSTNPNPNPIPKITCENGVCINPDKYNYLNNAQTLTLYEPFGNNTKVPWGSVSFSAFREKPWDLIIKPREYSVTNIVSVDEDSGKEVIHNQMSVKVDGKEIKLPITSSKTIQQMPESKFRIDITPNVGVTVGPIVYPQLKAEVIPFAAVSFFSYGETKQNPTLTFLDLGIGVHTQELKPSLILNTLSYNVGEPMPLLSNFYLTGPMLSVDTGANIVISAGIKVEL